MTQRYAINMTIQRDLLYYLVSSWCLYKLLKRKEKKEREERKEKKKAPMEKRIIFLLNSYSYTAFRASMISRPKWTLQTYKINMRKTNTILTKCNTQFAINCKL